MKSQSSIPSAMVSRTAISRSKCSGFTLIELLVAMGVFLVIAGTALTLFKQHANLFGDQQSLVGLNITMRNALSQIQTDALNAGDGYYFNGVPTTSWPIGITITNQAGSIDILNIITAGSVPSQLDPAGGVAGCYDTTTANINLAPAGALSAAATAAQYGTTDEVLFINGAGNQMNVAMLTAPGAVVGGKIQLTHTATSLAGNPDTIGLTTNWDNSDPNEQLATQFCSGNGDWVIKLSPIQYTVNAANQLTRTVNGGVPDIVADQIIGFKVGAATFTSAGVGTSNSYYSFNAANAPAATPKGYNSKFNSIRSIRVSVIGRTPTQFTGTTFSNARPLFRNSFDGGNYKIEALSIIVNPRNLSMND
jgi:prepilin-type N-terminal cleavage/methylation domain-containing protein